MTQVSQSSVTALHTLPSRSRLTTTHPHGAMSVRRDGRLALLRISKNASTELLNRLDCPLWMPFTEVNAPIVMFLRDPKRRFLSSIGETLLRVQHRAIEDIRTHDRVIVSEDVYLALTEVITRPIPDIIEVMLDLIEEDPFDAHHEHQISFFTTRDGKPRFDARVYTVENLEQGIEKVAKRYEIALSTPAAPVGNRFNIGGAKPVHGSSILRTVVRRLTKTGLYRPLPHKPLLALRYTEVARRAIERRDLNSMANHLAAEVKATGLTAAQDARIRQIYQDDFSLWSRVKDTDDRLLSELF